MTDAQSSLRQFIQRYAHASDFLSLRLVEQHTHHMAVTRNIIEPPHISYERGVMICVQEDGQQAFAATSDITDTGLLQALAQARATAKALRGHGLLNYSAPLHRVSTPITARPTLSSRCPTPRNGWPCSWTCRTTCLRTRAWFIGQAGCG